jgi:hypothetical protein
MTSKPQDRLSEPAPPSAALDELRQELGEIRSAIERQEQAATQHYDGLQSTLANLTEQLDGLAERLLGTAPRPVPAVEQPVIVATPVETDSGDWDSVLLGPDLAAEDDLTIDRQELLDDVRRGDSAAWGLLGQLLVFRAANSDRLPVLLKDIGEAYYRWRPSGGVGDGFRDGVIAWLEQTCAARGLANTIELVHAGDRYDSTRHNTRERGVEVTAVFGWVVLRDNGSVYTKANVSVK